MASVNKVIAIGNLGKDPEVKYLQNGDAVCNISIACTEKWKDKSGEQKEQTEWIPLSFYGRVAEILGEYTKKGSPIYVEGKFTTRKYEKDGETRYVSEVKVFSLQLLGSKDRDGGSQSSDRKEEPKKAAASKRADDKTADFDDDIPF